MYFSLCSDEVSSHVESQLQKLYQQQKMMEQVKRRDKNTAF